MAYKTPLWLDCDPGGDDTIAIMLASNNPSLELIGISAVCGNTESAICAQNALKALHAIGKAHIPVVKGADSPLIREFPPQLFHGESGLCGVEFPSPPTEVVPDNFIGFMYDMFRRQAKKVVLVALGPLTNIALLLKACPEIKAYIEKIVFMGGAINYGNVTPASEFNIWFDPEAASVVMRSKVPVAMVPLDCTVKSGCPHIRVEEIRGWRTPFASKVVEIIEYFQKKYDAIYKFREATIHDACALMYAVEPAIFEGGAYSVEVETGSKLCDGRTVVDIFGTWKRSPNVWVAENVQKERYWDLLIEALKKCNEISPLNKMEEEI